MIRELTKEEFEATLDPKMRQLADDDNTCSGVPLYEYVEQCVGALNMDVDADDFEFHYAYMNDEKQLCHVGLNFGDEQLYLVLVVDVAQKQVLGHTVLDFSKARRPIGKM